ncbi:uncharacterized protein L969DRAFT_86180 [Mixia osmundae IAM 14324]|uniref:Late embryogenesis abundant protein LEA-2 subgroup domain-containing protein n=1 Tax=Mixia osmundae (strain CBS 9802 / IAM 14324 / JCM 22182 / KY 12970) TaxID=764103 RepID=G7DSB5_MIXOS|nr:uncharacterized protein L969DRAFT_86180 [Mixia osmundae IAM 14324]KEI40927.1 hypothetical protein L969DRAFT_86180 [Mixia osmundae IAM 14324]GAA93475.1 hypothetical protein E5Q_00116 [Mixia osmundae IAM 14324]
MAYYDRDEHYRSHDDYARPSDYEAPVHNRHDSAMSTLTANGEKGYGTPLESRPQSVLPVLGADQQSLSRSQRLKRGLLRPEDATGKRRKCSPMRWICAALILIILIVIGVVLAFILYVRAPNVTVLGIEQPANTASIFSLTSGGFDLDFNLKVSVANPNYFGAFVNGVTAKAYYPTNKTLQIGGGTLDNLNIPSRSNTTFDFPFLLNYTGAEDPNSVILTDIATKCGYIGSSTSQIDVDYTLLLDLKVLAFKIHPTVSSSASFDCPLTKDQLANVVSQVGGSILGGLGSALGSLFGGGN